jgi:hypothetical protein
VVWVAGLFGLAAIGRSGRWTAFDPGSVTAPFGTVGDVLVSPAARWDSVWYLAIANDGYGEPARQAFFPLYPLLVRAVGLPGRVLGLGGADLLAGLAVSVVAFAAGLWCVHRLVALELGDSVARQAVLLVALFPTAFAFSAVYTEALYLALTAGALLAGRTGRWPLAGLLGALAAATRSSGALLLIPLALFYLYGPRTDRRIETLAGRLLSRPRWYPRHRPRWDMAWLALIPAGMGAFMLFLALAHGNAMGAWDAQHLWYREFAGPFGAVKDGAVAAWDGARQLLSGSRTPLYFRKAGGDPFDVAVHNIADFAFVLAAAAALVGTFRRLPLAYGAWALCALIVPLSSPVGPEPLASFPRYMAVVFPLHAWLAAWSLERDRRAAVVLGVSGVLLVVGTALFTTWRWVG